MQHPNRRQLVLLGASAALSAPALAQFRVEISGVGATQLPIAVVRFADEDKVPHSISAIISADLARSGAFRPIDNKAQFDETASPQMSEWRSKAADALVAGSVSRLPDGRFDVRFKLWDVVKGKELLGSSHPVAPAQLRFAAHQIADAIYEKLTGDKGVFSTRIAFVTRSGGRFALRVADADGAGGEVALNSSASIISPAWSPDGRELAYVSFEQQKAEIYVQDVMTGQRRAVASFRGSNSAPAWSPDGRSLAATLSREGGSQIYIMGRNGENPRRVTTSQAIDTEPLFSPDGRQLYFVSDRSGGPQVYRVPVAGGTVERVTFQGSYNISPAISPDGRLMAYISRVGGAFKLHVLDLAHGGPPVSVTESSDDESPSFAPNGKLIIYATRAQGRDVLMTTTPDGKTKSGLPPQAADLREPVWGPFVR